VIKSIGSKPGEAAKRFGDKCALVLPNRELSFNELDALSNRCANALVDLGIKLADRVTLYSANCWEWIVSYYGALKTGAVINPINVMLTPSESAPRNRASAVRSDFHREFRFRGLRLSGCSDRCRLASGTRANNPKQEKVSK
jgi:acyl-CoA synthetase (AMP-forming)/AMP-acid ligase II